LSIGSLATRRESACLQDRRSVRGFETAAGYGMTGDRFPVPRAGGKALARTWPQGKEPACPTATGSSIGNATPPADLRGRPVVPIGRGGGGRRNPPAVRPPPAPPGPRGSLLGNGGAVGLAIGWLRAGERSTRAVPRPGARAGLSQVPVGVQGEQQHRARCCRSLVRPGCADGGVSFADQPHWGCPL